MQRTRRRFLTTTAAVATLGGLSTSTTAADEYDVIEADNSRIWVREGETFENKIIDFSNGNWLQIQVVGPNCTVRNIGFKGQHAHDESAIIVNGNGGELVLENLYMGDGCIRPDNYASHGQVGIFVHRDHKGTLKVRNANIQNWPNNGIYANAPYYENGGAVHVEDSLSANNYVSNFRIGSSGSYLDNCVAYNDSNGQFNGRCLWAWGKDVEARNCEFDGGNYSDGTAIYVRDSTHLSLQNVTHTGMTVNSAATVSESNVSRGSPDISVPDGVPLSAEAAASGQGGGNGDGNSAPAPSPSEDPWTAEYGVDHIYEVENTSDEPVDYYLQVSEGTFTRLDYNGAVINTEMTWTEDDKAAGRVAPGNTHCWGFNHTLVDVTIDPESAANARVNGESSSLSWYPQPGADGDDWKNIEELLGLNNGQDNTTESGENNGQDNTTESGENKDVDEIFTEEWFSELRRMVQ